MKEGTRVKVGNDLSKTYKEHGSAREMEEMKGETFLVIDRTTFGVRLKHKRTGYLYTFSSEDLEVVNLNDIKLKIEAKTFDPSQLDL